MAWFEALSRQLFRPECVIEAREFLRVNQILGLFAVIVLVVSVRHPERTPPLLLGLVAVMVVTHLAGALVVALAKRALSLTLFVQGASLFVTTLGLVGMSIDLTWHATALRDVRYLPGIAFGLLQQASFELHFFGPAAVRGAPIRRCGLTMGVISELLMAAALIRHFVAK